jgi:hypothetical protein
VCLARREADGLGPFYFERVRVSNTGCVVSQYPAGMAIDIRLMRHVIAVAKEGGFQRAADRWELRLALPLGPAEDPEQKSGDVRTDRARPLALRESSSLVAARGGDSVTPMVVHVGLTAVSVRVDKRRDGQSCGDGAHSGSSALRVGDLQPAVDPRA